MDKAQELTKGYRKMGSKMFQVTRTADRLVDLAKEIGCEVRAKRAKTGTYYLHVMRTSGRTYECVIRVADHADAYCTADYSCDDVHGTPSGARRFLLAAMGTSERALRRLRKARKARQRAEMLRRAAEDAADMLRNNPPDELIEWARERSRYSGKSDREYWSAMQANIEAAIAAGKE